MRFHLQPSLPALPQPSLPALPQDLKRRMQVLQKAKARLLKARSKLVLGFGSKCFGNKTTVSPRGACFDTDSKPDTPKTEGPCIILFLLWGYRFGL